MRLSIRVTPKAGRDEVVGWRDGVLQVRVRAAPEGGHANVSACRAIAAAVGVPPTSVKLERGASSRTKVIEVGASVEDVMRALGSLPGAPSSGPDEAPTGSRG